MHSLNLIHQPHPSSQEVNDNENIADDFVPQVIRMCEYNFFIRNLKEAAEAKGNRRLAMDAAAEDGNTSLSGESGGLCVVRWD